MIFKCELGFVAFTWPNLCSLDLSLLFIVLVARNFVSGICKLKPKKNFKNLKPKNLKNTKNLFLNLGFLALIRSSPKSKTFVFICNLFRIT